MQIAAGLIELSFDTIQAIMVGFVHPEESAKVLAAYYLAGFLQTLLLRSLLEGLSASIDTLCRQAFEHKRVEELWLYCQAGVIAFAICTPLSALALVNGSEILQWLGQDPAIADVAGDFLTIYALAIPFGIVYSIMKSALHAQGVSTPIVVSVVVGALAGDTPAYFLAYHTSLGYYGLAFTGPIEWAIKTLVLIPSFARNELLRESWPGWKLKDALALVPEIAKLGVSSTLTVAFQIIGFTFTSLLAGLLPNPSVTITASSIFAAILTLAAIPLVGINTGGAIRISSALGEGKARRAALTGRLVLVTSMCLSGVGAVASVHIARPLATAFTPDHHAVKLAEDLAHAVVPIVLLLGVSFGLEAILRGSGGSLLAAKLSVVCIFVLGAPLGLVFAMELQGGVAGLWLGNVAGTAAFAAVGLMWLCGLHWEQLAHTTKLNGGVRDAAAS